MPTREQKLLLRWFEKNQRPFPWRQGVLNQTLPKIKSKLKLETKTKNRKVSIVVQGSAQHFYRTWVSEVMLQQTTGRAVIPYYKNFLRQFKTLRSLARASESQVLAAWSGLGYYSRAKNLHKAAQMLAAQKQLPRQWQDLILYPGFGPYTARSVSSLVYGQSVGVLDGNVIRVLSRKHALNLPWWQPQSRQQLQALADAAVQGVASGQMNQALMELGATICLPQKPKCVLCPWLKHCKAQARGLTDRLPLSRPKPVKQMWLWQSRVQLQAGRVQLAQNTSAPFLKGQWLPPARARRVNKKPVHYDFCHSVTKYQIFVQIKKRTAQKEAAARKTVTKGTNPKGTAARKAIAKGLAPKGAATRGGLPCKWVPLSKLKQVSPTSFMHKQITISQGLK